MKSNLLLTLLLITIYSCGGKDSDNETAAIPIEDQTVPPVSDDRPTVCLTFKQSERIRSLLNRLTTYSSIHGTATDRRVNTTLKVEGDYVFSKVSDNVWGIASGFCSIPSIPPGPQEECEESVATVSFKQDCFYYNDLKGNLRSTISDRLSFSTSYIVDGINYKDNLMFSILSSGRVQIIETNYVKGKRKSTFTFLQDP
ncbi:MAG TPA: hypothetical protein VNJ08_13095 [Bacteriovoracaceae bacterium]|nr:hypothetical protein [Bacteriovoracaceae bacterium]